MNLRDETGIAFPLTLIVVLVLTVLGVTLYLFSTTETRQVKLDEDKMQAHYIARSGAHMVASYMVNNRREAGDLVGTGQSGDVDVGDGHFNVEVVDESNEEEIIYRVVSTGYSNGISQKIDVTVKNVGIDAPLYANNIDISGRGGNPADGRIRGGDVVYGGGELEEGMRNTVEALLVEGVLREQYIDLDEVKLPCDDEVLEEYDPDTFSSCPPLHDPSTVSLTTGPNRHLDVNDSVYYEEIRITNGSMLIDPNGGNLLLKADFIRTHNTEIEVKLSNNNVVVIVADRFEVGDIYVNNVDGNGGHLLLYVVDEYTNSGNNNTFLVDDGAYANLYVMKDGTADLSGTAEFEGSIYAPHAKSVLTGNAAVTGWIIANEAEGDGGINIQFSDIDIFKTSINLDIFVIDKWRYVD